MLSALPELAIAPSDFCQSIPAAFYHSGQHGKEDYERFCEVTPNQKKYWNKMDMYVGAEPNN